MSINGTMDDAVPEEVDVLLVKRHKARTGQAQDEWMQEWESTGPDFAGKRLPADAYTPRLPHSFLAKPFGPLSMLAVFGGCFICQREVSGAGTGDYDDLPGVYSS